MDKQKPSERIKEIMDEHHNGSHECNLCHDLNALEQKAIIMYLDEQYEKSTHVES